MPLRHRLHLTAATLCPLALVLACTDGRSQVRPTTDPALSAPEQSAPEDPNSPAITPGAPVTAELLRRRMGKPPMRSYGLFLTLENRHDRPIWLLFPPFLDDRLVVQTTADPAIVRFDSRGGDFGGNGYPGRARQVIEVQLFGGAGFRAFHLPARGRVVLDGFGLSGSSDVDRMDVWEVDELRVNGRRPLEEWLPYPVTARVGAVVTDFGNGENMDWDYDRDRKRDDYPDEKVTHVDARVRARWVVPLVGAAQFGLTR